MTLLVCGRGLRHCGPNGGPVGPGPRDQDFAPDHDDLNSRTLLPSPGSPTSWKTRTKATQGGPADVVHELSL